MKTVFHVADGADDVQDAAIRYAAGIFENESVTMDAVAVVANASGIELVRSDSDYAEEIAELSEGAVQFVACEKSMQAAGLTRDDILDVDRDGPHVRRRTHAASGGRIPLHQGPLNLPE